jgi:hypothetical protein
MSAPNQDKPYGYIAYIDEAGDDGLYSPMRPEAPGASEWMVMSAVVVRAANETTTVKWVRDIVRDINHGSDFMGTGGTSLNAPHVVEMGWLRNDPGKVFQLTGPSEVTLEAPETDPGPSTLPRSQSCAQLPTQTPITCPTELPGMR